MQDLTTPMLTALAPRTSAASVSRNRTLLFEIYSADFFPALDGTFDPSLAIARWAKTDLVWLGNSYDRRIVSHSTFSQFISGQFNSGTLTIENADRYLAQFVAPNIIDGMRLVVRYINIDLSSTLADSVVTFVGRLESPDNSELDREQGDLTAKEELASLDVQVPKRTVSAEDPNGRSPNDLLYEGFMFNARPSTVRYVVSTPTRRFLIFSGHRDEARYNQWSSVSETDNAVVPSILGRVQRSGLPVFWVDIGYFIVGLWVYSGHKITSITNFQLPDSNYQLGPGGWTPTIIAAHVHLGDPGGTGTNAIPDTIANNYPQNTALLSRTGYCGFAIGGPESASQPFANPQMDSVPTLVAIVRGECDLPDGSGVFNQKGFSDSPVYLARFVLTSQDFFGVDPRLVYDDELPAVHAERQRPTMDKSNGEFLALMSHDASALTDGRLTRLNSTGLIDSRYFRHLLDPSFPDPLITNRNDVYSVLPGGLNPSGGDQQLTNGAGLAGQSVGTAAWKYYYIDTPIGADQLQVTAIGSGDGATYLRLGSKPTLTNYDAFAYTASPQICTITNPTAGRWWIGVAGFQPDGTPAAGLSYSIIAIFTNGATGAVLPVRPAIRTAFTLNVPLTDTTNAIDFLNDVVLASGRLYRLTDSAGRQRIRAKKASDSAYLVADATGPTAAAGTVTLNTLPVDGDTITVNGITFTFRIAPSNSLEILIGATVDATVNSAALLLNASTDPLLLVATYTNSSNGVLTITHDPGASGNSFTLAKISSHITLSGSTLAGGIDGDTSILIANVEPWRTSFKGYVLINVGLTSSEYRKVTSADYDPTIGNGIGLSVSGTGLTASGATLAGGSTSVSSSGTVTVSSASGDLVVTVWGIPISYTVSANDNNASVAGMLTAWINADPNLRQYVRAVWNQDNIVHIYSTVGKLNFTNPLASNHSAQVDSPVTAPAASSVTSGTLAPGDYYLGYTLVDGSGDETLMSPLTKVTITSGHKVSVSTLALPPDAAEVKWYFSPAPGDDHVQLLLRNVGSSFTINSVPDPDLDYPPTLNTTGGETIRVMEVFNQFNTRAGSFKWVPSRSKINQITGTFIDAANGFKPTPVNAPDKAHQRAIKQINKKEINLSGTDNFSEAMRLCYAALAEERDGGAGAKWATDDAGIPLEIGDVVAVNDTWWNGTAIEPYVVNQPLVIKEVNLSEDFDVSFAGTVYSSSLLEGQSGRKPIVISTTLKYVTEAPPVATNLVLTPDDTFITGIIGDFDFGSTAHLQTAIVYMKGPAISEPSDSTYQLWDVVLPDANNHGHFEIRAIKGGQYWVKVVTESAFGKKASSGHPIATIDLRAAAVSDVEIIDDGYGDWLISFTGHPRAVERPESYTVEIWTGTGRTDSLEHKRNLPVVPSSGRAVLLVSNSGFAIS